MKKSDLSGTAFLLMSAQYVRNIFFKGIKFTHNMQFIFSLIILDILEIFSNAIPKHALIVLNLSLLNNFYLNKMKYCSYFLLRIALLTVFNIITDIGRIKLNIFL